MSISNYRKRKKKFVYNEPIYKQNLIYGIPDWIPSQKTNYSAVKSDSWFDINKISNPFKFIPLNRDISAPIISADSAFAQNRRNKIKKITKDPEFFVCDKIRVYPNDQQIEILNYLFDKFTDMFNVTVNYIRSIIFKKDTKTGKKQLIDLNTASKLVGFQNVRKHLMKEKHNIQTDNSSDRMKKYEHIHKFPIPIHVLDEAINQASANYKTCLTLLKEGHIRKFRVRLWEFDRRRKIIKLPPYLFKEAKKASKSLFFFQGLSTSKSVIDFPKLITLQFDQDTRKYIFLAPKSIPVKKLTVNKVDCGIDLGVRTFATVYSKNDVYSICNNSGNHPKIKKYHKKINKINKLLKLKPTERDATVCAYVGRQCNDNEPLLMEKQIDRSGLRKGLRKYHRKIGNMVKDMHFKVAYKLVSEYYRIHVGKLSTKKILSRNNIKISKMTKRMIGVLSPYLFRQRLIHMGAKYGSIVKEVNEYLTTKTCSHCGSINELKDSKIHNCKCGMLSDRDVNAAKNMLKVGYEKPRPFIAFAKKGTSRQAKRRLKKKLLKESEKKIKEEPKKQKINTRKRVNTKEIIEV